MIETLTFEHLNETLSYDPDTGIFRWKTSPSSRCKIGSIAGSLCKVHGYRHISIQGRSYKSSRQAMFVTYGKMPKHCVDHINGNTSDNRISNLREATVSQNGQNTKVRSDNKSGLKGALFHKRDGTYYSRIKVNDKLIYLGYFQSAEDAHDAYCAAAKQYFGEFARFQ